MRANALQSVSKLTVPRRLIEESTAVLQRFGRRGFEGFLLWIGSVEGAEARVVEILVPPQESLRSEEGVGYFVTGEDLFLISKFLGDKNLRLLAQVHSHPTEAFHSSADDRYAVATAAGSFSLVVPDFGFVAPDLRYWAVYRLLAAKWQRLSPAAVANTIDVK